MSSRQPRRRFLSNTAKIVLLGTVLSPLEMACNNNKTSPEGPKTRKDLPKGVRKKWKREMLVVNTKTGVMHLPTAKLYTYYDEINQKNAKLMGVGNWSSELTNKVHMHREQSGNITEILVMNGLRGDINDAKLTVAIDDLSVAFSPDYEKFNEKNFRLHELMLQLIALNNTIPADQKWQTFETKVKKPANLRKRQAWMSSEASFNERVNYITERKNDYLARLSKRASQYYFN